MVFLLEGKLWLIVRIVVDELMNLSRYLLCIFVDLYDGFIFLSVVFVGVRVLLDMGCYEVSLGDIFGVGLLWMVCDLFMFLFCNGILVDKVVGYFYDIYG